MAGVPSEVRSDTAREFAMYGIACVIIPTQFASLQAALDESLAPFRRGGREEFQVEKLAFNDVTGELERLHGEAITLKAEGTGVVVQGGQAATAGDLDFKALSEFMRMSDGTSWSGRFADIEPDFEDFARRFTHWKSRDPDAGGYGKWRNPLGRWDWWELGGRFDGALNDQRRSGSSSESMISSGPNRGRDLVGGVMRAFGGKPSVIEAEIEANIDPVSSLLDASRCKEEQALPTAVVLPVRACLPKYRWFEALGWRPFPGETKAFLSVPGDATFEEIPAAAYERHASMAATGIAYHL